MSVTGLIDPSAAVGELGAEDSRGPTRRLVSLLLRRTSNRSACALALLSVDILLVGGLGALVVGIATQASGDVAVHASLQELVFLGFAPMAAVLFLWRERAYVMEGAGPRASAVAIGWLNASGLIVLGICALDALVMPQGTVPNTPLLIAFVVAVGAALLCRHALWLVVAPRVTRQMSASPAVVVGTGAGLSAVVNILNTKSEITRIVAVISSLTSEAEELLALVRGGTVRTVFIVLSTQDAAAADPLIAKLMQFSVAVRIIPDIAAIAARARGISVEADLPVLHISDPPLSVAARMVKRLEDIVLSSLLLLASAPVMLLTSIAIKLDSPGPVLFRQPRHGFSGTAIEIFKFRTMFAHHQDRLGCRQTARGDPRVTRVGAFLRRHSLDELPQLLNVLSGSMSIVGPRAHPLGMTIAGQSLETIVANYMARHRVKPGITGLAQVSACRGNLDTEEKALRRVNYDLHYIENWSLLLDLRIILRTIGLVLYDDEAF